MSEPVTVCNLLEYYGLGEEVSNQQVTDRHLSKFASSYGRHWRSLRAELGLEAIVEHDIDHSIPGDEEGRRNALFRKWKLMKGSAATYKVLISALLEIKCQDDAEGVCKVLKQSLHCQTTKDHSQESCQANQQELSATGCRGCKMQCELKDADDTTLLQQKLDERISSCAEASCSMVDPEVREDLVHILRLNRKRIITQYAHYVSSICDCIVDRGVSVERLRTYLLKLPAFASDEDENQGRLLSGVEDKLEKADTIYKIIDLLGKECASFLNYDIYESIQSKFCRDVKCDDFKYPERLKAYIDKHKVNEFFDVNPQLEKITDGYKKLCLKLDIEITSKVAKVVNLKSSVAALLGLKPSALRLFSVEEGCVIVTFLIPAFVADIIFTTRNLMTSKRMKSFQDLSVLWIKYGDFYFDLRANAGHSEITAFMKESSVVEGKEPKFPEQKIMHKITCEFLSVGLDGHYYQFRDYNANDNLIKAGAFGSVRFAEDLSSKHLFAIKSNKTDCDSNIKSIETEARLLSKLGPHSNVIQMYGAVLDCQEHEFLPTRMYKLMMELSQHGDLAEMVVDPETSEPFPLDREQALFYFWQVLKGVDFLHKNNVLHLDIKGSNILIFDEGKTLKICDFSTAVRVEDCASLAGKNIGTLQFSSPEICRLEMPHFSSDMWSTMCVLVEMLTGQKPWHSFTRSLNRLIYRIGWYKDEQMETELLPPDAKIDLDLVDLMRLVLHANGKERASAAQLLQHPLIISAYTYEACFDEVLEEYFGPMEDDHAPVSEECAPVVQNTGQCQEIQDCPGHSRTVGAYVKVSKNSWSAEDINDSYGRLPSCGRGSDSGLDTPFLSTPIRSSGANFSFTTHPEQIMESGNIPDRYFLRSQSMPNMCPDPITEVQRSYSLGSHSPSFLCSFQAPTCSTKGTVRVQNRLHPCPCSYSRLRHSNSAPIIGDDRRRRLSLQPLGSYGSNAHSYWKLRRTLSEIYIDCSPDIDSPDGIQNVQEASSIEKHMTSQGRTSNVYKTVC